VTKKQELAEAYEKITRLEAEIRLLRTQLWLAETLSESMSLSAVLEPQDDLQEENNRLWDALIDTHQQRTAAMLTSEQEPLQDEVTLRLVDLIR